MWTVIITILRRNFSRRGFHVDRGDRLAELIVKGSRGPWFCLPAGLESLGHVPSGKSATEVHDTVGGVRGSGAAVAEALSDDGSVSIFSRGEEAAAPSQERATTSLAEIERQFALP